MIKNYFRIAYRYLIKQKVYSIINILGLAIGIACCVLLFLYVQHELQHDRFHENAQEIYRLIVEETDEDGVEQNTLFPEEIPKAVKENLSGVTRSSGFVTSWSKLIHDKIQFNAHIAFVDSDFFQMFS